MQFQNENTLSNAGKEGKTGEFHKSYDDAVIRVKKDLAVGLPDAVVDDPFPPFVRNLHLLDSLLLAFAATVQI